MNLEHRMVRINDLYANGYFCGRLGRIVRQYDDIAYEVEMSNGISYCLHRQELEVLSPLEELALCAMN